MIPSKLLLVDDDDAFRAVLTHALADAGYEVVPAGSVEAARMCIAAHDLDLALVDLCLGDGDGLDVLALLRERQPRVQVVMLTGHGTIASSVEAMRRGAFDYLRKPCSVEELEVTLQKAQEHQGLLERNAVLTRGLARPTGAPSMIGGSPAFLELLDLVDRVAEADAAVLVLGETGAGKDEVARRLHAMSPRRAAPLVTVDCAALDPSLLTNELFGHERGSYTGATAAKPGLFEVADRGTLFLDEVGELTPETQTRLLRVIETGRFRRVGGTRELSVDVRVVAATNRDLDHMMSHGQFRRDLYYRLSTICVEVPPLRRRREDVAPLCEVFLARLNVRRGQRKRLSAEALERLCAYDWPGNVRELLHVIERAHILSRGDRIDTEGLPAEVLRAAPSPAPDDHELLPLSEVERRHIERVVAEMHGNRARAASILGIGERTLYRKLKDYESDS